MPVVFVLTCRHINSAALIEAKVFAISYSDVNRGPISCCGAFSIVRRKSWSSFLELDI